MRDDALAATDPELEWERYMLVSTMSVIIVARNRVDLDDTPKLMIKLSKSASEEQASSMQQLTLLLMIILMCCLCVACCIVLIRLRCKFRRRVQGDGADDLANQDAAVDEETRNRNRRIVELREEQQQLGGRQGDGEAMRRVAHLSLIDQYTKLIPVLNFRKNDKELDEFNTTECVICMDQFNVGVKVRKIPSCRHIFHDECLMKWLSGS